MDKPELVKGKHVGQLPAPKPKRVVFVPRNGGGIDCIDAETFYALTLEKVVEVELPADAVGFEYLGG